MVKFATHHKVVWYIGEDIKNAVHDSKVKNTKRFIMPSENVGVVYSKTYNMFKLYIGYKAPHKKARSLIMDLALKLNVTRIEITYCESMKILREWDKLVYIMNKNLFASDRLFS